ncbi:MAG TPA: bifunctional UDP-4-keto-pentose/UDP-xylose synthase [Steroidobacteraceae bacterium]|jgi:nucleoside-diphosphate-sugar epimerase
MPLKVLILGVNGFIGSWLTEAILARRDWHVYGMDIADNKLGDVLHHPRFKFVEGDITINREWVAYNVRKCDVVLPLVAIANPAQYVKDPLRVFELDFEANLSVVRQCVAYGKRLIFPSTSELYGMCPDQVLDETASNLVYGPIDKQRWIYAASKQLLDRVIFAYGVRDQFDYTLFRPFNWIGPRLDDVFESKEGSSRVFTQFLSNVFHGQPILLVDGGRQRRSFTYIEDAVECLLRIIDNDGQRASRQIFNIGNPASDVSVANLAQAVIDAFDTIPQYRHLAAVARIESVDSESYYGKYYQDIQARVPAISAVKAALDWEPRTDLATAITKTLEYHVGRGDFVPPAPLLSGMSQPAPVHAQG